ncbi:hypothetical protein SAMN05421636_103318 [Pricia antarctica]|uniref:Uncharacterized protein n=1 Tax=Pricia antarctica TaxID=641691 RepID=A0A1G7ABI3_9FLAO|nr:hypothetical protein SAMN05421636_103318 [Pricia antarctica]
MLNQNSVNEKVSIAGEWFHQHQTGVLRKETLLLSTI